MGKDAEGGSGGSVYAYSGLKALSCADFNANGQVDFTEIKDRANGNEYRILSGHPLDGFCLLPRIPVVDVPACVLRSCPRSRSECSHVDYRGGLGAVVSVYVGCHFTLWIGDCFCGDVYWHISYSVRLVSSDQSHPEGGARDGLCGQRPVCGRRHR